MTRRRIWTKAVVTLGPNGEWVTDFDQSEWYWHDGPVASAHNTPSVDQDHFRFYEPGTESGSAAIGAEDANIIRTTANAFQVRILLQESGNANTGSLTYKLFVSKNGGAYNAITAVSSNVQAADDTNIADDAATTSRLVGGTGSFKTGAFDDVDGATTTGVNVNASGHTELLFSVTIVDADVSDLDTLDFRIYDSDDTVISGAYNVTGRVTVDKSSGASHSIVGAQTVTASVAATMDFTRNADIIGAQTVTMSVAAELAKNQHPAIIGDETVTMSIAATLAKASSHAIVGAQTVNALFAAVMDVTRHFAIVGDQTVAVNIAAALARNIHPAIIGAQAVDININAALDFTGAAQIVGDVPVTASIAAVMDVTRHHGLVGSVTVDAAVAASLAFSSHATIVGDVTASLSVAAAMDFARHHAIIGTISVPITPTATLLYTPDGGFSIVGSVPVAASIAGTQDFTRHAALVGSLTVSQLVNAILDFTSAAGPLPLRTRLELAVQAALTPILVPGRGGGATGYLRRLAPYVGDFVTSETPDDFLEALGGATPAILYYSDEGNLNDIALDQRRADNAIDLHFLICSGLLRSKAARTQGGVVGGPDPGIYQIMEDVLFKLFGVDLGVDGVGFLEPVSEQMRVFAPNLNIWEMIFTADTDVFLADEGEINANETEPPPAQSEYTEIAGRTNLPEADGELATGTGDSFTFSTPTVTLLDAGASFDVGYIGRTIAIAGAATEANNGRRFKITGVPSPTTIEFNNAAGVAEAFGGTWTIFAEGIEFTTDVT